MRRIACLLAVITAGLAAPAAMAADVTHAQDAFSGSFVLPAGFVCDFPLQEDFTITENIVIFGDPDNPDKVINYQEQEVTHTNVDTGFSLSEVDHTTTIFDASSATLRQMGLFWHLRTTDGKLVVVQAGKLVFDANTGELISFTPHINPDGAQVICPALGGNPAP